MPIKRPPRTTRQQKYGPKLSGNTDGTTMDDCIAQCHEAQKERAKKSYDSAGMSMPWSTRHSMNSMNAEETRRYPEWLQAGMKASIVTHLYPSAQAADSRTRHLNQEFQL
ncbi:hypothetical protein V8E54_001843 [Elaphomyces granulatus]|jgi:hypothetical protein